MLDRDCHHPSIIIWGLCFELADVISINIYPGWYDGHDRGKECDVIPKLGYYVVKDAYEKYKNTFAYVCLIVAFGGKCACKR